MTQKNKANLKWILTVIGSVVVTVIASTVKLTTKFNANDADHIIIKSDLKDEVERSTSVDIARGITLNKMGEKMDEMSSKQIQVMTNQGRIISDIEDLSEKIDKVQ